MTEKEIQKLRKEKIISYIVESAVKTTNMNNSNLTQDL